MPCSNRRATAWIKIAWPFCSTILTDIYHPRSIRDWHWSVTQIHGVNASVDDTDLGPIAIFGPAEKLASREMADRGNESGMADFLSQTESTWRIELFGAVESDAE